MKELTVGDLRYSNSTTSVLTSHVTWSSQQKETVLVPLPHLCSPFFLPHT